MRRIQLSPVIGSSFLALAMLGTSCGQGNGPAAQRFLPKGAAVVAASYTVGGTVTGLSGAAVVLQNNGADDLSLSADGPFTFATALADGSAYAVTVLTQPAPTLLCTVASGSGTIAGRRCGRHDTDLCSHQLRRHLDRQLRRQRTDRAA